MNQGLSSILRNYPGLESTLDSLDEQFPVEAGTVLRGRKIIERILEGGRLGTPATSPINVFPGGVPGHCREILLVAIGTVEAELKSGLEEALNHVGIDCRGTTRTVLFYAMWWSGKEWAVRRARFQKLGIDCWLRMPFQDFVKLR